jgi:long-chain acyl-CoA synthetase
MNFTDYLVLKERSNPAQTAIRSATDEWTYAEVADDMRRFANVLHSDSVAAESRVAVMLPNTYEFVVAMLGMLARKHVTGLIDPRTKQAELESLLSKMEPAAVVTTADNAESIHQIDDSIVVYCIDDIPAYANDFWERVDSASSGYQIPETRGHERALMLHTSGSTGEPKAVIHSHENFINVSDLAMISYELQADTTYLAALPLYHCWGVMNLGAVLKIGGEVVLLERWEPEEAIEQIETHAVDFFAGVPTMYKDLLATPDADTWTPESLEVSITGGAGVPSELIPNAQELLDCPVLNGWGMTETFAAGVWEEPSIDRRIPSVGTVDDRLFDVKVVDQTDGSELSRGETGELLIKGDATMERYLGAPKETKDAFTGEWFHTGDLARIDQDGYVYLQERANYMIITGGENIYPQEVEDVIEELDGIRHAVVVGKPDERKGEKPVAFVDQNETAAISKDEIKNHCLERLAAFKHPREVTFIDDPPRNSVGKIERKALAEQFQE